MTCLRLVCTVGTHARASTPSSCTSGLFPAIASRPAGAITQQGATRRIPGHTRIPCLLAPGTLPWTRSCRTWKASCRAAVMMPRLPTAPTLWCVEGEMRGGGPWCTFCCDDATSIGTTDLAATSTRLRQTLPSTAAHYDIAWSARECGVQRAGVAAIIHLQTAWLSAF